MTELLDHLGRDTLPEPLVAEFVRWCVWDQARSALLLILEKATLTEIADEIRRAPDLTALVQLGQRANQQAKEVRGKTGPLGYSAAEAAAFEFTNMTNAASDDNWDAEGVAFFASRVCGWAGWAATDFMDPMQKTTAEEHARREQASYLETLWRRQADNN